MKVALFKKKPVIIEALQFTGSNYGEISVWMGASNGGLLGEHVRDDTSYLTISTLDGTMTADPGDWIIKGVQGEFYPCKPDIFEANYTPMEEDQ